jgi:hypothetical protein
MSTAMTAPTIPGFHCTLDGCVYGYRVVLCSTMTGCLQNRSVRLFSLGVVLFVSTINDSSVPYSSALPSNVSVVGCSKHGLWLPLMQDGRGEGPDNVVSSLADYREVRSAVIHPDGVLQYPVRNGQVPLLYLWACVVHAPRLVS